MHCAEVHITSLLSSNAIKVEVSIVHYHICSNGRHGYNYFQVRKDVQLINKRMKAFAVD